MKALRELADKIDALATRERGLLFVAILAVLIGLWSSFVLTPYQKAGKQAQTVAEGLERELEALELQQQAILARAQNDPNRALAGRANELQAALQALDVELAERTKAFIPPRRMGAVLEDLLRIQPGLELVALETLAPERIELENQPEGIALYRHGIELVFEGDYRATLRFLMMVEELPWQLFWERLDYEVEEYPKARIRLRIRTLSTQEEWIGV